jgi:hypothetical protein
MWRKVQQQEIAAASARKPAWHAVEILAPKTACPAARALKGKRFLSAEAPVLPLPQCSRSGACGCVYKKHTDRRADARREEDDTGIRRFVMPADDRRKGRGGRKSDQGS